MYPVVLHRNESRPGEMRVIQVSVLLFVKEIRVNGRRTPEQANVA